MLDGPSLVVEWAYGWSLSRGGREPVAVEGGWRIDVGLMSRYVVPVFEAGVVARLGLGVPGTEIKVLGSSAALRGCLGEAWSMYDRNELMVSVFGRRPVVVPVGYSARVADVGGSVVVAEVRDGAGDVVSSGRLARWGGYGIVDRVRTGDLHRRRGLATVVVASLGNWAVGHGLRTGLLSASAEGAAVYRRLGWGTVGEIAGAVRSR